jgi:hypothetical protein
MRQALLAILIVGVTLSVGCGRARKPAHPVSGKVLVKGQPAVRAQVTFHPVEDARPDAVRPVGHVDEQGNFRLTTWKEGDGAPAGEYRVTVQWFRTVRDPRDPELLTPRNILPSQYSQAETSGLTASITKGSNELAPFQLEVR